MFTLRSRGSRRNHYGPRFAQNLLFGGIDRPAADSPRIGISRRAGIRFRSEDATCACRRTVVEQEGGGKRALIARELHWGRGKSRQKYTAADPQPSFRGRTQLRYRDPSHEDRDKLRRSHFQCAPPWLRLLEAREILCHELTRGASTIAERLGDRSAGGQEPARTTATPGGASTPFS